MSSDASFDRYAKQIRFAPLGESGQARLRASGVLIVGVGALGSVISETLTRSGVGRIRLVDRDVVELSNLQRQTLYTERDVHNGLPKAIAAAERLQAVNSQVEIDPHVADLTHQNLRELADGVDLLLDGTDNFATRFLLNDFAQAERKPWVYAGVVGSEGRVMPIVPGRTACLACLLPEPPPPGDTETCDSAGVLGPAVNVVASLAAAEALKLLTGNEDALASGLTVVDLWRNHHRRLSVPPATDCPVCQGRRFDWLEGRRSSAATVLCGQGAVQINAPVDAAPLDLGTLRRRLEPLGEVSGNAFLLRVRYEDHPLTVFTDGRVIVGGVENESEARSVIARCLGV